MRLFEIAGKAARSCQEEGMRKTLVKTGNYIVHIASRASYPPLRFAMSPLTRARRRSDHPVLENLIKDQKILIVGSGPSAEELGLIPDDVKVFTCNRGLKLLTGRPHHKKIDLYLCTAGKMRRMEEIETLLREIRTELLVIDDVNYIKKKKGFKEVFSSLVFDDGKDDFYLKSLIAPYGIRSIRGGSYNPWTSTGIRLLQYALYFRAREIYLVGIDFGGDGYFWGRNDDKWLHADIDENFMKIISKKFLNVYSLSQSSPISRYVPCKGFENLSPKLKKLEGVSP